MKQRGTFLYVTSVEGSARMMCYFWCPGCDRSHCYWVQDPDLPPAQEPLWTWDGNVESPTFNPSLLVHSHKTLIDSSLEGEALTAPENVTDTPQCHIFINNGIIDFLGDCTHPLAGQKVPMVPLPDFMRDGRFVDDED